MDSLNIEFLEQSKLVEYFKHRFVDVCNDFIKLEEDAFSKYELSFPLEQVRLFWDKYISIYGDSSKLVAVLYDDSYFIFLLTILEGLENMKGKKVVYLFSSDKDILERRLISKKGGWCCYKKYLKRFMFFIRVFFVLENSFFRIFAFFSKKWYYNFGIQVAYWFPPLTSCYCMSFLFCNLNIFFYNPADLKYNLSIIMYGK